MLQLWLRPQPHSDSTDCIFQQVGVPPHWGTEVHTFFNQHLPKRWIGRSGDAENVFCFWSLRSPGLLWDHVRSRPGSKSNFDSVYWQSSRVLKRLPLSSVDTLSGFVLPSCDVDVIEFSQ
ncbi:uncharacterized protein TNCT_643511 [Trichonephila clavata]|uniref:Uncharacterized protein n=1 Tax=Trichonephila clavata TaxID=2740835 RepID=A0A8X6K9P8_TRICU|nr:uncharacterized protein TNCT_643511 [Trichonephila clavata]